MAEYDIGNYARKTIMELDESYLMQTLNLISGKWKMNVLMLLDFSPSGSLRYGDIKHILRDCIAPRVLIQQLRELESSRLVTRVVYPTSPIKVEYSLTELGQAIIPLLDEMYHFGFIYREAMRNQRYSSAFAEKNMESKTDK